MSYRETLRIRYRDTDAQGHMFFANYLVFADEVTGNYMRTLGFDWSDPESLPTYTFTANANIDYLHECLAGDEVEVSVGYTRIGNTSATVSFELTRVSDGSALARGSFVQVFVDRETRRPTPVPESVREAV
ncbi:MAG: thioesterase family protein, partial [Halieaceae bacterium]|nr:thioesterase family protein [Halieaceae bacterium]